MSNNQSQAKIKDNSWITRTLFLWLGYCLLAIMLTWPTVTHLTTHLPGDGGDDPAIAWNLWWVKYALLNTGQNPFQSDFLFYPLDINLAFYTLTLLNAVTALPLTLNFGVVTASNLHLLFTFVVGGYGAFLLAYYLLTTAQPRSPTPETQSGSRSAIVSLSFACAAIAGGFYVFAGSKLFYVALGQFNIASSHWIPFAVLYLLRTRREPNCLKNPLIAGLFLTLQAWTEMTYASFLLVFIGLYWIFLILDFGFSIFDFNKPPINLPYSPRSAVPSPSRLFSLHLRAAVVLISIFVLGLSPILAQMLPDMLTEGDFLVEGSGFAQAFSADGLGFFVPTQLHPLLGHLVTQTHIQNFDKGQHIYLGFVLFSLLLVGLWIGYRRPELRFWLIAAVVFALLCLGPVITINGYATELPGPFVLLQNLPFFKGNRYPSRYSVMLLLSLSVITAFALNQISRRFNWQLTIGPWKLTILPPLLALLFLFEHLSIPLPQSDMRLPAPYQLIATAPGDFAVLDIPFAWRNGFRITGALTTQFMFGQFYQTFHQKRLLQGNTSRNPAFKFQYFTDAPVLNSLLALETGKTLPPDQWEADRAIAAEVLRFFNLQYLVVRPDTTNNPTVTPQATLPYIEKVLPVEKIYDEAALKIYRVITVKESSLNSELQLTTPDALAPLYFGEGWGLLTPGQPITAQRPQARLLLPLSDTAQRVTLRLRLPKGYGGPPQSLSLKLNGWQSPPQPVSQDWQELTFSLPAGVAHPGLNDLWLHFNTVFGVSSSPTTPDITVLSAGEEVGSLGHIWVNGHDISPNQRGYNLALLQPDGTVLQVANFDTHLDPAASTALVNFLAAAPPEAIIAAAVSDEASAKLSEAAVHALQTVGATADLRGCFRCSYAFIRPATGATLESLNALRPIGLTTNLGLTEPTVAAQLEWIHVNVEK